MLSSRQQRVLIGGLAALVLLVASVVAVIGNDDSGDDVSTLASSTTVRSSTTLPATSTSAPTTSTSAVAADTTATTSPATTTVTTEPPPAPTTAPPLPIGEVPVTLTPIAGLSEPVALAARPGSGELWVAEQGGVVVALRGGQPVIAIDLSAETESAGEQGMLGITFSAGGDRLYLSYTDNAGDSHVDDVPVSPAGDVDFGARRSILFVPQPFANHNGGNVVRGPDGAIWLGLGDGGSGGDPNGHAQRDGDLLGKLLRLPPGGSAFEIVAKGLRNPWRFSFDRATSDLWLADVGQSSIEEINRVPFASVPGADFAWDRMEGSEAFEGGARSGDVVPVHEYRTSDGCAVTGGFVYRGSAIPGLAGAYLYADYCNGDVRALRVDGDGRLAEEGSLGVSTSQLASFGEDATGELYVLSRAGTVFRLDPA